MLEAGEVSAVIDLGNQILGPRALTLAAAASSVLPSGPARREPACPPVGQVLEPLWKGCEMG